MSSKSNSTQSTKEEEETSIITLIPCEYDSSEEDDNSSQNSIDSSELAEDSDGEVEVITYYKRLYKNLDKIGEKSDEITIDKQIWIVLIFFVNEKFENYFSDFIKIL